MSVELILSIFGVIVAAIAAIISFSKVVLKRNAEETLKVKLLQDQEFQNFIQNFSFSQRARNNNAIEFNQQQLDNLQQQIDKILKSLDASDKKYLSEGLYQPSSEGRKEYLKRIFYRSIKDLQEQPQT